MKQLSLTTEPPTRKQWREQPDAVVLDAKTTRQVVELMARAMIAIVRGLGKEDRDDR